VWEIYCIGRPCKNKAVIYYGINGHLAVLGQVVRLWWWERRKGMTLEEKVRNELRKLQEQLDCCNEAAKWLMALERAKRS